jgi:sulfur-carrier protein
VADAPLVTLRMFARAREVAGTSSDQLPGRTVGEVLDAATARYGPAFAEVLACSRVWIDGDEPADGLATPVRAGAEVAVLPPVSGG